MGISSVATTISAIVLGRLGDRRGHRLGVMVGAGAQAAALIVMIGSAGKLSCLGTYFLAGLAGAGGFLSHTNMVYETCPHDSRIAHITVGNLVMGAMSVVCPILAGMAAQRWGLRPLFAGCLLLSAGALAWFALFVREPRQLGRRVVGGPGGA